MLRHCCPKLLALTTEQLAGVAEHDLQNCPKVVVACIRNGEDCAGRLHEAQMKLKEYQTEIEDGRAANKHLQQQLNKEHAALRDRQALQCNINRVVKKQTADQSCRHTCHNFDHDKQRGSEILCSICHMNVTPLVLSER